MPSELAVLEKGKPQYITMPGWKQTTVGVTKYDKLPKKARAYVEKMCRLCGVKPAIISTGARRDETIMLEQPFKKTRPIVISGRDRSFLLTKPVVLC